MPGTVLFFQNKRPVSFGRWHIWNPPSAGPRGDLLLPYHLLRGVPGLQHTQADPATALNVFGRICVREAGLRLLIRIRNGRPLSQKRSGLPLAFHLAFGTEVGDYKNFYSSLYALSCLGTVKLREYIKYPLNFKGVATLLDNLQLLDNTIIADHIFFQPIFIQVSYILECAGA